MDNRFKYPKKSYDEAIDKKNYGGLKTLLIGIIASDPSFSTTEFEEALDYISLRSKSLGYPIDLEESYMKQEEEYNLKDKSKWNKNYFQMNLVWLRDNFVLKERIPHIKEVGQAVFTKGEIPFVKINQTNVQETKFIPKTDEKISMNIRDTSQTESGKKNIYFLSICILSVVGILIYIIFQLTRK